MKTFSIPDLFINENLRDGAQNFPIALRYETDNGSIKNKVILNKFLLCSVEDGEKLLHFPDSTIILNSSQLLIASPGNCLMTEKLGPAGRYKSILYFFSEENVTNLLMKLDVSDYGKFKKDIKGPETYFSFSNDKFISNYFLSLESLLNINSLSDAMATLKLEEILLYLIERCGNSFLRFILSSSTQLNSASFKTMINDNIYNSITLDELAFFCNMSLATFKRHFAKTYGMSPGRWIHKKRMEKAKCLLSIEHRMPTDIYHELGYESLSSFINAFKKEYGITPKQFQLTLS